MLPRDGGRAKSGVQKKMRLDKHMRPDLRSSMLASFSYLISLRNQKWFSHHSEEPFLIPVGTFMCLRIALTVMVVSYPATTEYCTGDFNQSSMSEIRENCLDFLCFQFKEAWTRTCTPSQLYLVHHKSYSQSANS